jgi:hypothetical protein
LSQNIDRIVLKNVEICLVLQKESFIIDYILNFRYGCNKGIFF